MKTIEKTVQHCWKPMTKCEFEDDVEEEDFNEGNTVTRLKVLRRILPNQYIIISFPENRSVRSYEAVIENLRELGINIGREEDSEYGYKMPTKKGDADRQLKIFRRY